MKKFLMQDLLVEISRNPKDPRPNYRYVEGAERMMSTDEVLIYNFSKDMYFQAGIYPFMKFDSRPYHEENYGYSVMLYLEDGRNFVVHGRLERCDPRFMEQAFQYILDHADDAEEHVVRLRGDEEIEITQMMHTIEADLYLELGLIDAAFYEKIAKYL